MVDQGYCGLRDGRLVLIRREVEPTFVFDAQIFAGFGN
jgi:hypothetical protein